MGYKMVLRLINRGCLEKEQSIFAEETFVGALQIQLQFEIVTDMLLFSIISSKNTERGIFFYYMQKQEPKEHIVFIRHGESMKNAAVKNFRISRGMEEDWDLFYKTPDFLDQVIFNTDLIDCHLSEKGVQQCQDIRKELKDLKPDLILCSPLQRALETARNIFPDYNCPRIAEPLLSQTFKHSSQVCRSIDNKKKEFSDFDFSKVEAQGEFWFIKNNSEEIQQKYFKFLEDIHFEGINYREKAEKITHFMNKERHIENPTNVRERARKVKQLLREYSKKYNKIAVVSHFFTIKFLNATEFNEKDEPVNKVHMRNCGIFPTSLQELNKTN